MADQDIKPSERLTELLKTFTADQLRFVDYRMHADSDKEAAEQAGMNVNSIYQWRNKQDINEAVQLAQYDGVILGWARIHRLLGRAIDILSEGIEQGIVGDRGWDAMLEVLDRLGMTAPTKHKHEGTGDDGSFVVRVVGGIDTDDI